MFAKLRNTREANLHSPRYLQEISENSKKCAAVDLYNFYGKLIVYNFNSLYDFNYLSSSTVKFHFFNLINKNTNLPRILIKKNPYLHRNPQSND